MSNLLLKKNNIKAYEIINLKNINYKKHNTIYFLNVIIIVNLLILLFNFIIYIL
jgi:hypothetical protein